MRKETYTPPLMVMENDEYAKSVVLDSTTVAADSNGDKILKEGTIIGNATGDLLQDLTLKGSKQNNGFAQGILTNKVNLRYGDLPGTVCFKGIGNLAKIEANAETVTAPAKTALTAKNVVLVNR